MWGEFILYLQAINIKRFFLEYPNSNVNIVRQDLHIDKNECKTFKTAILPITRFFNPQVTFKRKHIFISSYYRYSRNPNSINVTIVHDFTYEYYRKGMARWIHTLQKRNAIRHSKGVICISENTKKDLQKRIIKHKSFIIIFCLYYYRRKYISQLNSFFFKIIHS